MNVQSPLLTLKFSEEDDQAPPVHSPSTTPIPRKRKADKTRALDVGTIPTSDELANVAAYCLACNWFIEALPWTQVDRDLMQAMAGDHDRIEHGLIPGISTMHSAYCLQTAYPAGIDRETLCYHNNPKSSCPICLGSDHACPHGPSIRQCPTCLPIMQDYGQRRRDILRHNLHDPLHAVRNTSPHVETSWLLWPEVGYWMQTQTETGSS